MDPINLCSLQCSDLSDPSVQSVQAEATAQTNSSTPAGVPDAPGDTICRYDPRSASPDPTDRGTQLDLTPPSSEARLLDASRAQAALHKDGHVELCKRDADLPLGHTLHVKHHWIRTSDKEAGMGEEGKGVPGHGPAESPKVITRTTINDHTGEGTRADATCKPVPKEDEACVDQALEIGKKLGTWGPTNNCQTFAEDVLRRCSTR